jgi:AICAR transformylase/IMP cyclohydrolase PurH
VNQHPMDWADFLYGSNPHRADARVSAAGRLPFAVTQGSVSFNNLRDALHAWACASELTAMMGRPCAVAVKHGRPVGAAAGRRDGIDACRSALDMDSEASEKSWLAWPERVAEPLAEFIVRRRLDGLAVPSATASAANVLAGGERLRRVDVRAEHHNAAAVVHSGHLGLTFQEEAERPLSSLLDPSLQQRRRDPLVQAALFAAVVTRYTPVRAVVAATADRAWAIVSGAASERESIRRLPTGLTPDGVAVASSVSLRETGSLTILANQCVQAVVYADPPSDELARVAQRLGIALLITGVRLIYRGP